MAKIPPPPRNIASFQTRLPVAPPQPEEAPDNLSVPSSGIQDMNFKVSVKLHRQFKTEAAMRGMSMKELLEAAFKAYLEKYPSSK